MSLLYLVRHGQADRLGKNYDRLTPLGWKQAAELGKYFLAQRIEFDSVFTGTLNRQKETASAILESFRSERFCIPDPELSEYWNEFEPRLWLGLAAKIRNIDPDFANAYDSYKKAWEEGKETTREFFQTLMQKVLKDWVEGVWDPVDPYTFQEYVTRIQLGLDLIQNDFKSTLVVSSSTPIAIVMGIACGLKVKEFPVFMKYILNSSLSVFKREGLVWEPVSFNSTGHLKSPDDRTIV